jgi:enhancer of mRNA-decapping protein 3
MRIDAANIADLSEIKPEEPPTHHEPKAAPVRQPQLPLQDPAILSLARPPASTVVGATELQSSPVVDAELEEGEVLGGLRGNHVVRGVNKPLTPIQDVAESLDRLQVGNGASKENIQPADTEEEKTYKRRRRRQNNRARQHQQQQNQQQQELQSDGASSTGGNVPSSGRGKGWRQTPMLQSTASFQPFNSLKRRGRGRKGGDGDNGWESADVTEEMGDFDFENNLLKFDKRTIFDQMRRDDEVDDASRLVAHNRRPKPGTNNGKNLHYSENVLEVPPTAIAKNADFWNSEADEGLRDAERLTGRESRAATSMRRTESKHDTSRRSQSRKASGQLIGGHPLSRVSSTVSALFLLRLRGVG